MDIDFKSGATCGTAPCVRARAMLMCSCGSLARKREGMDVKLEGLDLKTLEIDAPLGVGRKRELAAGEKPQSAEPSPLKRIRERHLTLAHAVATAEASTSLKEIALRHGVVPGTLYRLCQDPSFKELIAHYRAGLDVALQDSLEKLGTLAASAIDELQQRLDEQPEEMTTGQLLEIMKAAADRSGHGPQANQNVNINVGFAARLNEARNRVKTIDVTPGKKPE